MKLIPVLLLLLLILPLVSAANIEGTIYDLSFNRVSAIVKINTTPLQTKVAQNGDYSFIVPKGTYLIQAESKETNEYINQTIKVQSDGEFTLDLVLYPVITNIDDIQNENTGSSNSLYIYIIIAIVILLLIYYFWPKKQIKEYPEDNLETNILQFIKDEKTTSQREIRKKFPQYSEAKISLIVSKLESQNKINKYKKGRANIISIK